MWSAPLSLDNCCWRKSSSNTPTRIPLTNSLSQPRKTPMIATGESSSSRPVGDSNRLASPRRPELSTILFRKKFKCLAVFSQLQEQWFIVPLIFRFVRFLTSLMNVMAHTALGAPAWHDNDLQSLAMTATKASDMPFACGSQPAAAECQIDF